MQAKNVAIAGGAALGLILGGAAGFVWGQGARKRAPSATSTSYDSGVLTVKHDVAQTVLGGARNLF